MSVLVCSNHAMELGVQNALSYGIGEGLECCFEV